MNKPTLGELAQLTLISQQIATLVNDINTPKSDVRPLIAKKREIDKLFLDHIKELDTINLFFKPIFFNNPATDVTRVANQEDLSQTVTTFLGSLTVENEAVLADPPKDKQDETVPPPVIDSSLANPSDIKELSPAEQEAKEIADKLAAAKLEVKKKKGRQSKNV